LLGIILYEKTNADAFGFFESEELDCWWLLGLAVLINLRQNLQRADMKRVHIEDWWPETWKYTYLNYDLQEIYGEIRHYGYAYAYANRRKHTLRLVQEVLPKGATILDVAAAQGNFTLSLAELGYEVTWNDLRVDLEDYVRIKHEKGIVHYAPGNAFELGYQEKFDCVLITEIIEHVAHPDEFLKKTAAMVKPGGYVIMSTPNGRYFVNKLPKFSDCPDPSVFESQQFKPNSDGHIFLLWPGEIEQLGKAAGLVLEKHSCFTNSLTAGHVKLEALLKVFREDLVDAIERFTAWLPAQLHARITTSSASRYRKMT
jgi:2-polyprenyl-3-methyl-5-hydroxy-6-metoxy-1,4-benzoquinol methylase